MLVLLPVLLLVLLILLLLVMLLVKLMVFLLVILVVMMLGLRRLLLIMLLQILFLILTVLSLIQLGSTTSDAAWCQLCCCYWQHALSSVRVLVQALGVLITQHCAVHISYSTLKADAHILLEGAPHKSFIYVCVCLLLGIRCATFNCFRSQSCFVCFVSFSIMFFSRLEQMLTYICTEFCNHIFIDRCIQVGR